MKRCIAVMAKSPEPGTVKTRLVGGNISPEIAAELAAAFLTDTLAVVAHPALAVQAKAEICLALDGSPNTLPESLQSLPRLQQQGNSLSERIVSLIDDRFAAGYTQIIIVGSDTPHLPTAFVQEAFGRLATGVDAVFGPADDGRFYLVGVASPLPVLFTGLAWGQSDTLKTILALAAQEGLTTALLPVFYTIDTVQDVARLTTDLRRRVVTAPATAARLAMLPDFPTAAMRQRTP